MTTKTDYRNSADLVDILPADAKAIYNAMHAYRECAEAIAVILKRRGFTGLSREDVSWLGFAQSVEQTLEEQVKQNIKNFEDMGIEVTIRDDDHQKLFDDLFAYIKGKEFPAMMEPPMIELKR